MNTGTYYSSEILLAKILPMVDDRGYRRAPKGFYISLIQQALEELGMSTFFDERRESFDFPSETLTLDLPKGCFNVKNVYLFNGDECNIANSIKVWWKRNYFTRGNGFIANDKWNNFLDPFYSSHNSSINSRQNLALIRYEAQQSARFYYNIQMGKLMLSSYCRGVANKVHIHYNGIGGDIADAPIIPVFLRTAVEDWVIETILRFLMAEDYKRWAGLWQIYDARLNAPYTGSKAEAELRIKSLNSSESSELFEYLSRAAWSNNY